MVLPLLFTLPALVAPPALTAHQAKAHPMRYHLALPEGWAPDRTWPVVVVVPDAHRDFEANLRRFAAARGSRPYLLVAPEVLTCGGASGKATPPYAYTPADWSAAEREGDFAFDDAGLAAVLAEVQARWAGEPRAFLTGWEAGGHSVWAQAFRRPERWRAVAPVSSNYQGRGLTPQTFSTAPARAALPLKVFWCGAPQGDETRGLAFFRQQTAQAQADARAHGFKPLPDQVVPGQPHGPLCEAVLAWFDELRAGRPAGASGRLGKLVSGAESQAVPWAELGAPDPR
ncbi:MAG TPA: hypothetical protein VJ600_03100 [Holophagaceae bacterium]|nr:hypothetical protein [Holophagaceae bacterium]